MMIALMFSLILIGAANWKVDVKALTVTGDRVYHIVNTEVELSESIVIEGNATLLIENSNITFIQSKNYEFGISLQNPANGNPRLIIRNATLDSKKTFRVSLYGNSTGEFDSVSLKRDLDLHDSSTVNVFGRSTIYYIRAYDRSNVNVIGSNAYYLYAYDEVHMDIFASEVNRVEAHDTAEVDVSVSTVKYSVRAYDSSHVLMMSKSSVYGNILSEESSSILFLNSVLSKLECETYDYGNVSLVNSTVLSSKLSSTFSLNGTSTLYIDSSMVIDASFEVYENSTVTVRNSNLTSVYARSFENSLINVLNSSINWLLECEGSSSCLAEASSFVIASGKGSSTLSFNNCKIAVLRGFETSNITSSNSIIKVGLIELNSVNVTLTDFGSGFFDNLTFTSAGLSVTFLETRLDDGWNLNFYGSSNVTLRDSRLLSLGVYDSSKVWLWNSTLVEANVKDMSEVHVWSYLTISVVDYFGNPVEGATVAVTLSGVQVESKLTGKDGVAVFELFENFINASGSYPAGDYGVTVVFGDYSSDSHISLSGSQSSILTLQLPWWYWYMISGLIVAVAVFLGLGVFLMFKRRKKSGKKV